MSKDETKKRKEKEKAKKREENDDNNDVIITMPDTVTNLLKDDAFVFIPVSCHYV